jgi:hypothetical protein
VNIEFEFEQGMLNENTVETNQSGSPFIFNIPCSNSNSIFEVNQKNLL